MKNKHLIMGTAGHVDHGKTSLIKSLTGFDCDTHLQEKKRGITINLGFTHIDLDNGNSIGIVDVPGHSDFISTMVSGASGIDFVLFIISAEEGIMPQTTEHFEIMKMLGIKKGVIALTKIDLVDNDFLDLVIDDINEFVNNSFLENADIVPVSIINGKGLDKLNKAVMKISDEIEEKDIGSHFRMYIDRIFSVEGYGTIVNGSVLLGQVKQEDNLFLLPSQKEVRVRRIEKHGKSVDVVNVGDRASFNLVGLRKNEFERGFMLSNKIINSTQLVDVQITLFPDAKELELWTQIIFLCGTIKCVAKVHLLDNDILHKNEKGLAQIYLSKPIVVEIQDHFIIRNSSNDLTIGGGQIIDPYPLHHRRRRVVQIDKVKKVADGSLKSRIELEVNKHISALEVSILANVLHIQKDELLAKIEGISFDSVIVYKNIDYCFFVNEKINRNFRKKIMDSIYSYNKDNPLIPSGRTFLELSGVFGKNIKEFDKIFLTLFLKSLIIEKKIKKVENTFSVFKHTVDLGNDLQEYLEKIYDFIEKSTIKGVEEKNIIEEFSFGKFKEEKIKQMIAYLIKNNEVAIFKKKIFSTKLISSIRKKMIDFLINNKKGITLAEFRDLINGNRASALTFLEMFDQEGITIRREEARFLRVNYMEKIK